MPNRAIIPSVQPQAAPAVYQNPGPTEGAFGETAAAGLAQDSKNLAAASASLEHGALEYGAADQRIKARRDAILNQKAQEEAEAAVKEAYLAEQTGGDNFTTSESVARFRTKAEQATGTVLQRYRGQFQTEQGPLLLNEDLTNLAARYHMQAVDTGITAGKSSLQAGATAKTEQLAQIVAGDPSVLDDALGNWNNYVTTRLAAGMTPDEEMAARNAGTEAVATAAVDQYNLTGQYEQARKVLANPTLRLSQSRRRELNLQITAHEVEQKKVKAKTDAIASAVIAAGYKQSDFTATQWAAMITGVSLPNAPGAEAAAQIQARIDAFKRSGQDITSLPADDLANYLSGHAIARDPTRHYADILMDRIDSTAVRINEGAAVTQAEVRRLAMDAAQWKNTSPAGMSAGLPGHVSRALEAWGYNPNTFELNWEKFKDAERALREPSRSVSSPPGLDADQEQAGQQRAVMNTVRQDLAPLAQAITKAARSANPSSKETGLTFRLPAGTTWYNMADKLTGLARLGAAATNTIVVGELLSFPELVTAQTGWKGFINDIARAQQVSDKMVQGEFEIILDDLKPIEGTLLGNPAGLRAAMEGVSANLEFRLDTINQSLADKSVGGEARAGMAARKHILTQVLRALGAPPKLDGNALAAAVKSGRIQPGDWVYVNDHDLTTGELLPGTWVKRQYLGQKPPAQAAPTQTAPAKKATPAEK